MFRKWLKIYSEAIQSRYVNKRDKPQMRLLHLVSRKLKGKPMLIKRIRVHLKSEVCRGRVDVLLPILLLCSNIHIVSKLGEKGL